MDDEEIKLRKKLNMEEGFEISKAGKMIYDICKKHNIEITFKIIKFSKYSKHPDYQDIKINKTKEK